MDLRSPLAALPFALLSLVACTITVNEEYGHGHGHDTGHAPGNDHVEACLEEYGECVDDADDAREIDACGEAKELCLDGSSPPEEPEDLTELCIDLQVECLEEAEDSEDVEACEALFDHCVQPQVCVDGCAQACSAPGLSSCLGSYIGCAGSANSADELDTCEDDLEGCTGSLGSGQCLPSGDSELLDLCLAEHSLCVSLGFGDQGEQGKVCSAALTGCTGAE